jgi:hypothetical protein
MWKQLTTGSLLLAAIGLLVAGAGGQDRSRTAAEEKVQPGSALAKLIAEVKQHPAIKLVTPLKTETGKGIRSEIPAWLRAHYLRNHPQALAQANPKDPTGGMPLALDSLYVWMLRHPNLEPSPAPKAVAAVQVEVGQNLRISGQNDTPRSESDIRINYMNPKQIIAASNNLDNGRQAQFYSQDGGSSWGQTTLPLIAGDSMHSDPTVDWTSNGTAWATTIGIGAGTTNLQMRSYKSTDGGQTWTFDGTFSGDQTSADKQMVCVDRSSTPHKDTLYAIWHNGRPAFVNRRTSTGWQAPHQVSGAETTGTAIGADITTNSAGDVFAVWPDTGSQKLYFVKSTDGGGSYSTPTAIAKTFGSFQIRVPAFSQRAALVGVSLAAFRNDTRNDVYVSWVDLSGEPGCETPASEPGDDVNSACKSRVYFMRSTNGGADWEQPQRLNDAADKSDQFNQKLTVDPETGILGIVY